ncbi:MAG: thermonuclease family protein [Coriobacteriia bacterium]|nr:thermonuclease family protein [Coriobacteriia bacterium]
MIRPSPRRVAKTIQRAASRKPGSYPLWMLIVLVCVVAAIVLFSLLSDKVLPPHDPAQQTTTQGSEQQGTQNAQEGSQKGSQKNVHKTATTTVYKTKAFKVYDGDTFHAMVNGVNERVRVIGIDAPEMDDEDFPEEAKASQRYASQLVNNKTVWLEVDNGAERDRHGRILAYVWLVDPAGFDDKEEHIIQNTLNGRMLDAGYAKSLTVKPNTTYREIFESRSHWARKNDVGLWPTGVFARR